MARPKSSGGLTIAQLERMLENRRRETAELLRERNRVQQRLDAIDRKIAGLSGGRFRNGSVAGGGRARNPHSLVATLETVLGKANKPMQVADIVDAVQSTGYRSSSPNFRGIVNQTLIKEKRFTSAGRGLYQMKK